VHVKNNIYRSGCADLPMPAVSFILTYLLMEMQLQTVWEKKGGRPLLLEEVVVFRLGVKSFLQDA